MSGFRVQITHPSINQNQPSTEKTPTTNMTSLFGTNMFNSPNFTNTKTTVTSKPNAGSNQGLAIRNVDSASDHY